MAYPLLLIIVFGFLAAKVNSDTYSSNVSSRRVTTSSKTGHVSSETATASTESQAFRATNSSSYALSKAAESSVPATTPSSLTPIPTSQATSAPFDFISTSSIISKTTRSSSLNITPEIDLVVTPPIIFRPEGDGTYTIGLTQYGATTLAPLFLDQRCANLQGQRHKKRSLADCSSTGCILTNAKLAMKNAFQVERWESSWLYVDSSPFVVPPSLEEPFLELGDYFKQQNYQLYFEYGSGGYLSQQQQMNNTIFTLLALELRAQENPGATLTPETGKLPDLSCAPDPVTTASTASSTASEKSCPTLEFTFTSPTYEVMTMAINGNDKRCNPTAGPEATIAPGYCDPKGPLAGCPQSGWTPDSAVDYLDDPAIWEQEFAVLWSIFAQMENPSKTQSAAPGPTISQTPNQGIDIAYQVLSSGLQSTDTYQATSFDPSKPTIEDPCTNKPVGWSKPTTQKLINTYINLPGNMDITYNSKAYTFSANKWNLAGGLLLKNSSGTVVSTCKRLPSSEPSQYCGTTIIVTRWATCIWYDGGGPAVVSATATAQPVHGSVCKAGLYSDHLTCVNNCAGGECDYESDQDGASLFGQDYQCTNCL